MARIGIIDWGIGGISIYKLIRSELPAPVTYFSDTGVTPYGRMTRTELASRLDTVIEFLADRGVTHVVVGCNAASTAIGSLRKHDVPVLGVIDDAVELAASLKPNRLGLIGGRRTVVSGVYRRAFRKMGITVEQRIAQPLSAIIENGDVGSAELRGTAKRILAPLRQCSHILLACTHYPAITGLLEDFVSAGTIFIDPAEAVIKKVRKWKVSGRGTDEFLTTGDTAAMTRAAKAAFGVAIPRSRKVRV